MRVAEILRLGHAEIWPVYRQLVTIRRVYRRLADQPKQPTPKALQDKYRVALAALNALEPELTGVSQYENMRELCRRNTSVALRPGSPKDFALRWLVDELSALYQACTGEKPTCYWNDVLGEHAGGFLSVCQAVDKKVSARAVRTLLSSKTH